MHPLRRVAVVSLTAPVAGLTGDFGGPALDRLDTTQDDARSGPAPADPRLVETTCPWP